VVRCQVRVPGQEHEERRKKSPVFRFGYGRDGRAESRANGGEDGRESGGSSEMQWRSYRQFDWRASVMRQRRIHCHWSATAALQNRCTLYLQAR
jgi:hypothetical protein